MSANSIIHSLLWYGPRPLHGSARYVASCVAAFVLLTTAGLALGASGGAAELASLTSAERAAAVELFATEVELARARAESERHAERERALAASRERLLGRSAIARGSLAATHERIGTLLRRLYVDGDADPIEVISARARSTPCSRGSTASSAQRGATGSSRPRRGATPARSTPSSPVSPARRPPSRWRGAARHAAATRLLAATSQKRATVVALQRRQGLTAARLEAESREAERAARRIETPTTLVAGSAPGAEPAAAPCASRRRGRWSSTPSRTTCPAGRRAGCPSGSA